MMFECLRKEYKAASNEHFLRGQLTGTINGGTGSREQKVTLGQNKNIGTSE